MKKIKETLISILYRIYFFIVRKISKDIVNTRTSCNTLIYNNIYIRILEEYKDNTIKRNNEFTQYLYDAIFGINSEIAEEYKDNLNLLKKEVINSNSKLIAKHYILTAYYDYYTSKNSIIFRKLNTKDIKISFNKAKLYDSKIKLIKDSTYSNLKKNIKSELKKISNQIKKQNREKIKYEKEKAINPIEIKMSYIITFFSIVSSLSLIGGILYNQLLFYFLGINATNFFNISDYISSSIDVLLIVFLSMIIAVPFYFLKISHILDEAIIDEQLGTNIQNRNDKSEAKIKWFIVITLIFGIVIFYYQHKELSYNIIGIFTYLLIIFYSSRLNFWKYIKNSFLANLCFLILINFLYLVISKSYTQANEIKNNKLISEYKVVLKEEIKDKFTFIKSNSYYTFLYDSINNKVIVIPNSEIKRIEYYPQKTD